MKVCSSCNLPKSTDQFSKKKSGSDGLQPWCKPCFSIYMKMNKQIQSAGRSKWARENRDKRNKSNANWKINNPKTYKASLGATRSKRRAILRGKAATLTTVEWLSILEEYNHACVYCGNPWQEMDHLYPLSPKQGVRMGKHTADNVVPACQPCNRRKSNNDPVEFILNL